MKAKFTLKLSDATWANIILADGRFLMQLSDNRPENFYPNHWRHFMLMIFLDGALRVVPYDVFALWTYIEQGRLDNK